MDRLDAMRAFVRLVELGTFSSVADELRIKQSTVSKWLATLEEELGTQLVERTTRKLRITESGERFYARAQDILAAFEEASAELQNASIEAKGRLRVSVPVVFGRLFVVPHLPKLLKRHPGLDLELVFADRYVNLVDEGIDVAIRVGKPVDSSFKARTLGSTARHLVAAPKYLETHGTPAHPRDLLSHESLLHTGLAGDTWTFEQNGKTTRAKVRGRFSANNSEALLVMAEQGLGIALLASWLVAPALKRGRLVPLLSDYRLPPAPIMVVMPPNRFTHPRVRVFVDFMHSALQGRLDLS